MVNIYCCGCKKDVFAVFKTGKDIYPHRKDLYEIPFWKCLACGNHVGTHHKSKNKFKPLGCIPTPELRNARSHIHSLIDPLWKSGSIRRSDLYKRISEKVGYEFHTAELRSIEEARAVYRIALAESRRITNL